MNQLSIVSNANLTMSSREMVEFINSQRKEGEAELWHDNAVTDITTVLTSALRDLFDADDTNRQKRYELLCEADQLAMAIAHGLKDLHYAKARVIQNLRMAVTLASAGHSPAEMAASMAARDGLGTKTYIALNPLSGLLKIGKSIDPDARMANLQTGAALKPELLAVIDDDIERVLHKRFRALRVFGEWFRDDGTIAEFIAEQKATSGRRGVKP